MSPHHREAGPSALVVGIGQRDRGDDAVGPVVAGRVAELRLPGVQVMELRDPATLLDCWDVADLVVVADAVRSGRQPGTVQVLHACHGPLPAGTGAGGTHTFGLGEAVELARALGRMPPDLVIVAIEVADVHAGGSLSVPVRDAVATAVTVVTEVIHCARPGP